MAAAERRPPAVTAHRVFDFLDRPECTAGEAEQAQPGLPQTERGPQGVHRGVVTEVTRAFFRLTALGASVELGWTNPWRPA